MGFRTGEFEGVIFKDGEVLDSLLFATKELLPLAITFYDSQTAKAEIRRPSTSRATFGMSDCDRICQFESEAPKERSRHCRKDIAAKSLIEAPMELSRWQMLEKRLRINYL